MGRSRVTSSPSTPPGPTRPLTSVLVIALSCHPSAASSFNSFSSLPADSLLGNSLETAVNALRQPVFAEAGTVIRSTLDELGRTKLGFVEMKRLILAWIDTQLVPEIGKSTTRRDRSASAMAKLTTSARRFFSSSPMRLESS